MTYNKIFLPLHARLQIYYPLLKQVSAAWNMHGQSVFWWEDWVWWVIQAESVAELLPTEIYFVSEMKRKLSSNIIQPRHGGKILVSSL